jgi:hypothetical protein
LLSGTSPQTLHTENHCVTKTVIATLKQGIISKPRKIKSVYIKITLLKLYAVTICFSQKYPYVHLVAGLVWSNGPESHAGRSVATARVSLAGQVKGGDTDIKGIPMSYRLGVGA